MNANEQQLSDSERLRSELRAQAKRARSEMPEPYRAHKSSLICQSLLTSFEITLGIKGLEAKDVCVGLYSAFPEEVQLHDFAQELYNRGAKVAFPCMIKNAWSTNDVEQTMEMRVVDARAYQENSVPFLRNPLKTYLHEDEELSAFPYVSAEELTMIVVPVVAFDKEGNRLGYGGGNYDRYLTQVPSECRKAGVAFAEQSVDSVPYEEHDIPLPIVSL